MPIFTGDAKWIFTAIIVGLGLFALIKGMGTGNGGGKGNGGSSGSNDNNNSGGNTGK